jgi:hypothetical protein
MRIPTNEDGAEASGVVDLHDAIAVEQHYGSRFEK